MATERGEASEILLNALRRDQDRLLTVMALGFAAGFLIGVFCAWFMMNIH